jgi:hypothetical protein
MTAVDTKVLVRLLTGDDPKQAAAAKEDAIRDAFTKLPGLRNVRAEDESAVAAALALTVHGIELADAMHLCSRPPKTALVSFDRVFLLRAKRAGATGVSGVRL